VLTIAPHGGRIEPGTSEIAALIAGESYNLHRFEGRKPPGQNAVLHITSHHFDEPRALNLAKKCRIVLGIHGCRGRRAIYVGGRDKQLREDLAVALLGTGLRVEAYQRRSQEWRERIAAIARCRSSRIDIHCVVAAIHSISCRNSLIPCVTITPDRRASEARAVFRVLGRQRTTQRGVCRAD
jgi:hypothetical protein